MSDAKLRELWRLWKETGEARDEAAYLAERVRTGDLAASSLGLAAHLGHKPAQDVLGRAFSESSETLEAWIEKLRSWGDEAVVRACIATARSALPAWAEHDATDQRVAEATRSAEDWIACPCEEHGLQARLGVTRAREAMDSTMPEHGWPNPRTIAGQAHYAAWKAYKAAEAAFVAQCPTFPQHLSNIAEQCLHSSLWRDVLPTLAEDVVPWALRYGDPVRKRVEARRSGAGDD